MGATQSAGVRSRQLCYGTEMSATVMHVRMAVTCKHASAFPPVITAGGLHSWSNLAVWKEVADIYHRDSDGSCSSRT